VIFIHGQGEQRPMEDLRLLVDAVWSNDPAIDNVAESRHVWSTPDPHSDTLESRRLTTDTFKAQSVEDRGRSVDFFEFYWAHKMTGNRALDVVQWAFEKWPRRSPLRVAPAMLLLKLIPSFVLACLLLVVAAPISEFVISVSDSVLPELPSLSGDDARPLPVALTETARGLGVWWHGHLLAWGLGGLAWPLALLGLAWLASARAPRRASLQAPYVPLLWIVPGLALFWFLMTVGWLFAAGPHRADPVAAWRAAGHMVLLIGVVVGAAVIITSATTIPFIRQVMGDSSRYLRPAPDNIAARAAIRESGVNLLERLHRETDYDRVVIVAHSLGSIIAYDVLLQFWARQARAWYADEGLGDIFDEVEAATRAIYDAEQAASPAPTLFQLLGWAGDDRAARIRAHGAIVQARARLRDAQRRFTARLAARTDKPWLITDLVTLGSPLTYAKFVLCESDAEFDHKRHALLELPSCPPLPFTRNKVGAPGFTFPRRRGVEGAAVRSPRHDAVFAAVRWTNLYFPSVGGFWGDMIGGPIAPMFGPGIEDVEVHGERALRGFVHNLYWINPHGRARDPGHIQALRKALALSEPVPEPAKPGDCAPI
jgi:hypothetical protein